MADEELTPDPLPPARSPSICIDPGHGGEDPGAVAGDVKEKAINLAYGLALRDELLSRGWDVILTRDIDVFETLGGRADLANQAGADCFVSLHANASSSAKARGAWVIHAPFSTHGKTLALRISEQLAKIGEIAEAEVYPDESPWTGNRRLTVLHKTKMPAVLVELGFVTNDKDRAFLTEGQNQAKMAAAIGAGIAAWAKERGIL
jgi:N-acetylmuramoyl-L-alanine amidase